jgi:HAD superfamily hydrolase (TIGR01549 family)
MKFEAVLFDLDDTLLGNHMDQFMPGYLCLLRQHAPPQVDKDQFTQTLLHCVQLMIKSTDTAVSNHETFWKPFSERLGIAQHELETYFGKFYENIFPQLETTTTQIPETADLIQTCLDLNLKTVVATNPVFPLAAIEHRLRWAGIPTSDYAFDLVTSYEEMHATKPHIAYYEEILHKIGCDPAKALMVGDNWENDIEPASKLGMTAYWISPNGDAPPVLEMVAGYGRLADLYHLINDGWLQQP